ncbi:uncharacterized protein G2W53_016493 [Senna tora]|uniref:Uncharacterized protein n=1 Tax=Senna tora TaxID=362788 RepID=A0A834TW63_9FABA|nr:uncharacterized protein G2W53_016493 [Senna tora]
MCVFLFAICTYSIVLGLEYYNTNSPSSRLKQTLSYMLLLLGSLSSVSLLSILLRRPLLVWLLIITWGSMQLIIMASQLLKLSSLLCWISEIRMMKLVWKGWDYLVSIALMMGGVIIREIQSQQHLPK